jgi:hypothetical protein
VMLLPDGAYSRVQFVRVRIATASTIVHASSVFLRCGLVSQLEQRLDKSRLFSNHCSSKKVNGVLS